MKIKYILVAIIIIIIIIIVIVIVIVKKSRRGGGEMFHSNRKGSRAKEISMIHARKGMGGSRFTE
jgi:lipopolysaccharide/colanic/teichoic acid biosynthesis glycosyltransferase